jgi:hypothetical protein
MSSAKRASPCRLTSISPRGASIIYTGSPGHMVDEIACRTEPPVWDRPPTTCRVAIFSTVGGPDDGKPDDRTHTRPAARQQDCGRMSPASVKGPAEPGFCHGHGTTVLPVMGPPGVS